nr:MAG TPA: hypothetical protein [Caudoviricetes sp.]
MIVLRCQGVIGVNVHLSIAFCWPDQFRNMRIFVDKLTAVLYNSAIKRRE